MSIWWRDRDYLSGVCERVITADTTGDAAVEQILRDAGKRVPDEAMTDDGVATA